MCAATGESIPPDNSNKAFEEVLTGKPPTPFIKSVKINIPSLRTSTLITKSGCFTFTFRF